MDFPRLPVDLLVDRLSPPAGSVRMVLDTDTYNEIDDQFAVTHALLSPEHMTVEALYAAPFHNSNSSSPGDGMEKSYEEIGRLLDRLSMTGSVPVHRGSAAYLSAPGVPQESAAARDLVARAMDGPTPLYVAAIGAVTNVASAIIMEPKIIERIVVVWLGGNATHWHTAREFNLMQDLHASRLLFDCGVPLVQLPCQNVVSHMHTTVPELTAYLAGRGGIGDYLLEIVKSHHEDHYCWSKVIWDVAATAYLVNPDWVQTDIVHSPILTDQLTWSVDTSRHFIREAVHVNRDAVFRDLFGKIAAHAEKSL